MNTLFQIFVDADAFVALACADDANHKRAVAFLTQFLAFPVSFVTSNYVFAESVTIISMHKGRDQALRFIAAMQEVESPYVVRHADASLDALALDFFKKQTSKNTSFVDCTNMAFLQKFHLAAIFSFDRVYKTNGFLRAEEFFQTYKQAA